MEPRIYEDQGREETRDPDAQPIQSGRLYTQPYDLVVTSLKSQIDDETIQVRQISEKPEFQRWYVWDDRMASRLIESILLNIPIPPCYLAQDSEYKLDVIDGQQRIYSIFRFLENQFRFRGLEVLSELNGKRFFELDPTLRRKIETYTLRCVVVTNDSDPQIRFEVFERLNSNTVPLNAQELRNSLSRGSLMRLLGALAQNRLWLNILNRKTPDRRMTGEELILRFFAFHIGGIENYQTPQKEWLNQTATMGKNYSADRIAELESTWLSTIDNCLTVFEPHECFRRIPTPKRQSVNRALMDLTMHSLADKSNSVVARDRKEFYLRYESILQDETFDELITRGIDHKSRTLRRFSLWSEKVTKGLFQGS